LDADEVDEPIDDGGEDSDTTSAHHAKVVEHPLASVSDAELEKMLREDPASVGPMSVGPTNGGMLINGVQMPQGDRWEVNDLSRAWGTQETIDGLIRCIDVVHEQFPDSPKMRIGHVSARRGGPLSPHVSHQAGRDVDVSYYYTQPTRWFTRAHAGNLDRARTWAFVRALIVETDVEMILIDAGLQRLLREYAEEIGEDRAWLDDVFRGVAGKRPALIRHARGHATHIHVRFYSPIARETARRAQPVLVKFGTLESPQVHVMHRARKGDTLGRLANMYGTTVEAIKRANGLTSTLIRATRTYRIPKKGAVRPVTDRPISIPPRRLPPDASRGESTP
jgi:penicillin-insensitive murein endopeptidase